MRNFLIILGLLFNLHIYGVTQQNIVDSLLLDSLNLNKFILIGDSLLNDYLSEIPVRVRSRYYTLDQSNFTHSQKLHFTANNDTVGNYLIITSDSLYKQLRHEITTYSEDVHAITGYGIIVETESNATAEQLKDIILLYENNLRGVLFIGDIGEVMYEQTYKNSYSYWPCDLFYMDLNGYWTDTDSNGMYDTHTGDVEPEIFMARLSSVEMYSLGDEMDLIRSQLQKSHKMFWDLSFDTLQHSLNYINKDWVYSYNFRKTSLNHLWGDNVDDVRDSVKNGEYINLSFGKADYLSRLGSNKYEHVLLASHSNPVLHKIRTTNLHVTEIPQNNSSNIVVNLFCCSACDWTKASVSGYLGGAYLFSGKTLAVIGSSKSGSMLGFEHFYKKMALGNNVGESLLHWWKSMLGEEHTEYEIHWHYGVTLLGDPVTSLKHDAINYCPEKVELSTFPTENNSNMVLFKATKEIKVLPSFNIPSGVNVILSAPNIIFENGFNCNIGASVETRSY